MRILLIEDHLDSAEALSLLLEGQGYTVDAARDGELGIELARATAPDVVLIDLVLPGMDGYEVARRLRTIEATRNSTLVAVSGRPDTQRALAAGFDDCLRKPLSNFVLALLDGIRRRRTESAGPEKSPNRTNHGAH